MAFPRCVCVGTELPPSSHEDMLPSHQGLTHMTPLNCNYPLNAPSPNLGTLGVGLQPRNWGDIILSVAGPGRRQGPLPFEPCPLGALSLPRSRSGPAQLWALCASRFLLPRGLPGAPLMVNLHLERPSEGGPWALASTHPKEPRRQGPMSPAFHHRLRIPWGERW